MIEEIVPELLIYLTLISDIAIIIIFGCILYFSFNRRSFRESRIGLILRRNYFLFGLIVSFVAMFGSLFYSEIMGFTPCVLCWYQRIFMYPQAFMFAFALWKKDRGIVPYSILLSIIGGMIAAYHYVFQIGLIGGSAICDIVGYSVSCSETFFTNLGYITIPMMSLTAFVLLIILGVLTRR